MSLPDENSTILLYRCIVTVGRRYSSAEICSFHPYCWARANKEEQGGIKMKNATKYPVHVRDLNTRDICIVPVEETQTYYLIDCKPRPGQKKRCVNIRESKDLMWWITGHLRYTAGEANIIL